MGFISELLDKKGMKSFIRYAKSEVNNSYDVFDTLGERTGEPMGVWKLRMNMTIPQIIATCNISEK